MKPKQVDILVLGGAGVMFVALGLWALFAREGVGAPPQLPAPSANAVYKPAAITNPERAAEAWESPSAREGDGAWLFDVFTPPVIYYDVATHEFSVTPPESGEVELREVDAPFGVELVEVKRTPYRIQLVGYVGSEGDYLATFEDLESGATFLARAGRTVEATGVLLRSFNVEKIRDSSGGGTIVHDTRATAIIRDLRQDRDVVLVQKERLMDEAATAVLRVTGDLPRNVEVRSGGTVTSFDATFQIGLVTFDPPAVEVTRLDSGERGTEVRRLEPVPAAESATAERGFEFPSAGPQNPFGRP